MNLSQALQRYVNQYPEEHRIVQRFDAFLQKHPDAFERTQSAGHVTGSAWLLSSDHQHALLTHHRKLNRWLQLGGHADGEQDVLKVALREAQEESGVMDITPISHAIFDIDIHRIPARAHEPEHDHYDVRYLFQINDSNPTLQVSDESIALRWFSVKDIQNHSVDDSVRRLTKKWIHYREEKTHAII